MAFGPLLREVRVARGLDQSALARRAGTSQTYVSRVERGAVSPSETTMRRLMHALGHELTLEVAPLPLGNASAADLR